MRLLTPYFGPLVVIAALSCAGLSTPSEPMDIRISVGASRISLLEGESAQLTATVQRNGIAWPEAPVTWRSEAPLIASVDAIGRLTAVQIGSTRVIASAGLTSASAEVSVSPSCRIVGVTLRPATVRLRVNEAAQVTANANCDPPNAAIFHWRSSDSLVARVDSAGRITARATGTAIMTATLASDVTRSAAMRVDVDP